MKLKISLAYINFTVSKKVFKTYFKFKFNFNNFTMGLFRAANRWGGPKSLHLYPVPKICYKYPAIMKFGTVTPCLNRIQEIYKSGDKPLNSAGINIFLKKLAIFVSSGNTDKDYILIHFFYFFWLLLTL